jgi:tRNA dimethylallyltransferase
MSSGKKIKLLAIVGPTASGKTGLAVSLAYRFGGEIVSADSRQVYRQMDVGTGKDLGDYWLENTEGKDPSFFAGQKDSKVLIPYHLIDIADPVEEYNLARFHQDANEAIRQIAGRGRLPILAGGTGLYTQAVVDGYELSEKTADRSLRGELEGLSAEELLAKLDEKDPLFAASLNESERGNKRRLIRYFELASGNEKVGKKKDKPYDTLVIGVNWPREVLRERIKQRLIARLEKEDMIGEVERLHVEHGVRWERLRSLGLEYKYIAMYLQDELAYEEMVEKLGIAIGQFAKRQMSWYRRWEKQGTRIHWIKDQEEARDLAGDFLGHCPWIFD